MMGLEGLNSNCKLAGGSFSSKRMSEFLKGVGGMALVFIMFRQIPRWLACPGCYFCGSVAGWFCGWTVISLLVRDFPPVRGHWPTGWVLIGIGFQIFAGGLFMIKFRRYVIGCSLVGLGVGFAFLAAGAMWLFQLWP